MEPHRAFDLGSNPLQAEDAGLWLNQLSWFKPMLYFKEEWMNLASIYNMRCGSQRILSKLGLELADSSASLYLK